MTIASILKFLNYSFLTDEIILTIDFILKKCSVILFQINFETSKNHFSRYKSGLWTMSESRYNYIKRECRRFLKTLKKVRFWLYKVRFIIEIDVKILIAQLNRFVTNLFKVLIIYWLVWICLFIFDVRYIFNKKYIAIDKLFQKSREPSNDIDKVHEKNIDNFINDQFNCIRVYLMQVNEKTDEQSLKNDHFKKFQKSAYYLITLTRFSHLNRKKFHKFKNWALQFLVRDKYLFKRINKNILLWKIIEKRKNSAVVLKQFHNNNKHCECKKIYRRVTNEYW